MTFEDTDIDDLDDETKEAVERFRWTLVSIEDILAGICMVPAAVRIDSDSMLAFNGECLSVVRKSAKSAKLIDPIEEPFLALGITPEVLDRLKKRIEDDADCDPEEIMATVRQLRKFLESI